MASVFVLFEFSAPFGLKAISKRQNTNKTYFITNRLPYKYENPTERLQLICTERVNTLVRYFLLSHGISKCFRN